MRLDWSTVQSSDFRLLPNIVRIDKENKTAPVLTCFSPKQVLKKSNKMYKSIVNELANCETIDVKVRSSEGAEIVLLVKPEEKFSKLKEKIWKNIGAKTQLKIGDAILDIMSEYIQSSELSYDAFNALTESEQVNLLAKSGWLYQQFWQHYIALYDGLIIEDEASLVGLGMASGDEVAIMPRVILGRKENLFLQLVIGVRDLLQITKNQLQPSLPFLALPLVKGDGFH